MGMRTVNDPYGDPSVLVDTVFGTSYDAVRDVANNIDYVKKVANLFDTSDTIISNIHQRYVSAEGQSEFVLPVTVVSEAFVTVFVNGKWKSPTTTYTAYDTTLFFNQALNAGDVVDAMIVSSETFDVIQGLRDDAEASADRAQAWAETPEDTEVEPGQYSAKHYSAKANAQRVLAQTARTEAIAAQMAAEAAETGALGAATDAGNAATAAATSETEAEAAASAAATSAAAAAAAQNTYPDLPTLLAETATIPVGTKILSRDEQYSYEVVASGGHRTTAGGDHLLQVGIPNPAARGAAADGVTNDTTYLNAVNISANPLVDLGGKTYFRSGRFIPQTAFINGTIIDENGPWQFDKLPLFDRQVNDLPILIVATGQSNMLGHSQTSGSRATINNNVYMWEQFPGTGQTEGWKRAGPASTDWPFTSTGNSITYHFADMLQRQTGRTVLVVMQAAGGQPIAEWLPGGGGVAGATGFMYSTLNGALVGARAAPIPGRTDGATLTSLGIPAGDLLLWHQGEADADYRGTTGAQWKGRLRTIISTMRNPAGAGSGADPYIRDDAPVLVGQLLIGGTSGGNSTDDRNAQIAELDREERLIGAVSADGLLTSDNLHFDGESLVEFARRYYERMFTLPKPVPVIVSSTRSDIAGRLTTVRGTATINAGASVPIPLGVTFADSNYTPIITLTAHGSSSPYMPLLSAVTTASITLNNPGASNLSVRWEVTHFRA